MAEINVQQKIRIGSRGSSLALVQIDEILSLLAEKGVRISEERYTYQTGGDRDKVTPLTQNVADDFFTDALDAALIRGEIDIAVHSAKDLPQILREDLCIWALTKSLDETDVFVGKMPLSELPSGAKVGTSSLIRQNEIKKFNPRVHVCDIRGTIQERLDLVEQGKVDGIIVATVALRRLGLTRYIREIMPWEAAPLQGQLAVVGRRKDFRWHQLFALIDVRKSFGKVYLVGAGPGDPELITVKGVKILKEADCVFYDYLAHQNLLDYARKAEKIYVGKRKGSQVMPQPELNKLLRQKAMAGKIVVRLKGGDPLVFGRGADEITYLRSYHVDVQVIPGLSSATAIPSSLNIPLTARGLSSSVAFLSGHLAADDEEGSHVSAEQEGKMSTEIMKIPKADTVVFLMGLTRLASIVDSLREAGWSQDSLIMVVSKGTRADEEIVSGRLGDIAKKVEEKGLKPPALIVAGPTIQFLKKEALKKERILYTGTNPEKYTSFGEIVHFPMIEIKPAYLEKGVVDRLTARLHEYQAIIFTSRFAVKYFFEILTHEHWPVFSLRSTDFIVIGKDTAQALAVYDFEPLILAEIETGEGLFQKILQEYDVKGKRILFPRSSLPNPYLKNELTKWGASVDELAVYQNIKPEKRNMPEGRIDKILFTSPSTVKNFLRDYDIIPPIWEILSKGPVTRRCLQEAGYESFSLIEG
ncbi:MAG TPA: hypothetical protein DD723_01870 [Candidatus Omnitrophica bacterium]|nr:MAG: hypothetical protein A2Z81_08905 [Omnitrophica WOR_2 bacterium GWA2_45_18]OGX19780.1 MAG: hypothetical protein A2Y04_06020 [Omnitrophica WOR_2 bacterium GWC2_45_7]HBR14274.1 hypothetical protein [Candidatus Omnitrophota bacterium]